ncbi:hypothetical protein N9N21_07540, partial [Alphaproteobacteria bacterium]|nr:hypothetical protein [Alphaproteobacteria bacterium]
MTNELTINSLNWVEGDKTTFLLLEGSGLTSSDPSISLSFGNEARYSQDLEAVVSPENDISYNFSVGSRFSKQLNGGHGQGVLIDSNTPGYSHLSSGEFQLKFEIKPGLVAPQIEVDWAEINVYDQNWDTVLQHAEVRALGILDSGTVGISNEAPTLTNLSFREVPLGDGYSSGSVRYEISGFISQPEGVVANNIYVDFTDGVNDYTHRAIIESHHIREDGTFRFYDNFWSEDGTYPTLSAVGGYHTDSSGNTSFFDENLDPVISSSIDIQGYELVNNNYYDAPFDSFNLTSAYVLADETINIDINHNYFEEDVTYLSIWDSWGESVDWLSVSESGVLSGTVPSNFDHGGFNVEAVINVDGQEQYISTGFVDFKSLSYLDDGQIEFGSDLYTNSRTEDVVLINTSNSDVEVDGRTIGSKTFQLSDGSNYSMDDFETIQGGNGLTVAGSIGNDFIDLSGLSEESFSEVIYPFDYTNMRVTPGNDTLIAVDFKVNWDLLIVESGPLYAGLLNASEYWTNPMADGLLKNGDFDITFNGDGAVTFSDNANGFVTAAENVSLVQTVVGAETQVYGDSESNIIVSGGGVVDIWAGRGVDSFIITTDIDPMISPQLSMLIHDYEEGEIIRILDTGVATADDFYSVIASNDNGGSYQTEVYFNTQHHSYGSSILLDGAWELNPIDFADFISDHGDAALSLK